MLQTLHRAGGISLREVLPEGCFFGDADIRITSCSGDALACRRGDLFVARVGVDYDGHDQVREALQRGAAAVLAERYLPIGVPMCIVPNTHEAYGCVGFNRLGYNPCDVVAGERSTWGVMKALYR